MRKEHGINMPTTMARVAVPLSAMSSVGSWFMTLADCSAAYVAIGGHTDMAAAIVAGIAAAGKGACALIWTACLIATALYGGATSIEDAGVAKL